METTTVFAFDTGNHTSCFWTWSAATEAHRLANRAARASAVYPGLIYALVDGRKVRMTEYGSPCSAVNAELTGLGGGK